MKSISLETAKKLAQVLYKKKAVNIILLDVRGISSATDFVLIADGNVERHVMALAKEIEETMRKEGQKTVHSEGASFGDWIVLDFVELVVHLFTPQMRQRYQLERLWADAEIIDIDFDVSLSANE